MRCVSTIFIVIILCAEGLPCMNAQAGDLPSTRTGQHVEQDSNQLALDLYHRLQSEPGNICFSPASISTAFAMLYNGARGDTAAEMARVLHFEGAPNQISAEYGKLLKDWRAFSQDKSLKFDVANALWAQAGYPIDPQFTAQLQTDFQSELKTLNFAQADQSRMAINKWVSDRTQDKIKELIPSGAVNAQTRLVLTNAIYMKGAWKTPFDPHATRDASFTSANGPMQVPMMNETGGFKYLKTPDFSAISMDYTGAPLSMMIFLPEKNDGLSGLEKSLTIDKLESWSKQLASAAPQRVRVTLPKFYAKEELPLTKLLNEMGMSTVFSPRADFSGIHRGPDRVYLSNAFHQATVEVNEEGTEAAAATGLTMRATAVYANQIVFRADHPFLFLIRDNSSGLILFLGRLNDPR